MLVCVCVAVVKVPQKTLLIDALKEESIVYDFCMCNPPFFANPSEAKVTHCFLHLRRERQAVFFSCRSCPCCNYVNLHVEFPQFCIIPKHLYNSCSATNYGRSVIVWFVFHLLH